MIDTITKCRKTFLFAGLLVAFVIGFIAARIGSTDLSKLDFRIESFVQADTKYKFISPLLFCGDYQPSNLMNNDSANISSGIKDFIAAKINTNKVKAISVYFRDLNNGPYVDINATLPFSPGSLLKLPVAISIYKQAEKTPDILQKKIFFDSTDQNLDNIQYFAPPDEIKQGKEYTLQDLLKYSLVYSDNNAAVLSTKLLDSKELLQSFNDLGINPPQNKDYTISVKNFGSFFRILFNASYIGHDSSEYLLELMSHSPFTQGIVSGVPKNVIVSHKFGERTFSDGTKQLHDCGIVYRLNQPYVLCIMTQGSDFDSLAHVISGISSIVYHTLDTVN